jgi:hypothetical protein
MPLHPDDVETLLGKLCVDLGFCLHSPEYDELCDNPPEKINAFTNAVFAAEGMNPETADRCLYRRVQEYVAEAFRHSQNPSESSSGK